MVRVGKLGVHGFGCVCNLVMGQSVKVAIFEMSTNRIAVYIRLPQVAICLPNIQQIPPPGHMVRQNLYRTPPHTQTHKHITYINQK